MKLDDGRTVEWVDYSQRIYCIDGIQIKERTLAMEQPDVFDQLIFPEWWAEQKKRKAEQRKISDAVSEIDLHLLHHKIVHVSNGTVRGIIWEDQMWTVYGPNRTFVAWYGSLGALVEDGWRKE